MNDPKDYNSGGLSSCCGAEIKNGFCSDCLEHCEDEPKAIKDTSNYRKAKLGDKNPMWKGNEVGYASLHTWIIKRLPKPSVCQICKSSPPHDLANISQLYKRDLDDWEWLCRHCHMKKDGRLDELQKYRVGNKFSIGRKLSVETRLKISKKLTGRIPWNKGLKCITREKLKHIPMYHYPHKTSGTVETIPCYAVADVLALLDNEEGQ